MTTNSWKSGVSADWTVAADWTPAGPVNSASADTVIGASCNLTVSIVTGGVLAPNSKLTLKGV